MVQEIPSKEEFALWKENTVTQYVQEDLRQLKADILNAIAEGKSLGEQSEQRTAVMVGQLQGLTEFLEYELKVPYGH